MNEMIQMPGANVISLPHFDVTRGRRTMVAAHGATIGEMVAASRPELGVSQRARLRVTIGEHVVHPGVWHLVRPKRQSVVIIRNPIPQGDNLRSILSVAVLVAAVALGQFYAFGAATSLFGAGIDGILYGGATGFATAGQVSAIGSVITAATPISGTQIGNFQIGARP